VQILCQLPEPQTPVVVVLAEGRQMAHLKMVQMVAQALSSFGMRLRKEI
jgi:hypothetical protein